MEREFITHLEMMAGAALQSLLESKEATQEHLDDADAKMRCAALTLMTYHWGPTEQFKNRCEAMAFEDSDSIVRSTAMSCLGWCFRGTDDRRIEKLLASVVCDNTADVRNRRSAYISLFHTKGVPSERMPRAKLLANLRVPEDVDWAFVQAMMT
jgi:hypothetical protein